MDEYDHQLPDEKKLNAISDDPTEGFLQLIDILRETYRQRDGKLKNSDYQVAREYMAAYLRRRPGALPEGIDFPPALELFESFRGRIATQVRLKIARDHAESVFIKSNPQLKISINENYRVQIREIILHIRRVLDGADLPLGRKDDISAKLDAFVAEVEREVSRIDRLGALWLAVTRYTGEGAKNLEPVVRLVERIRKVIDSVQDEEEQRLLPPHEDRKQLEPPRVEP